MRRRESSSETMLGGVFWYILAVVLFVLYWHVAIGS